MQGLVDDQISQAGVCTADESGSCLIGVETYSACSFAVSHADYLPKLLVLDQVYHAADNSLQLIELIPVDSDDRTRTNRGLYGFHQVNQAKPQAA